jgi:hypothetical protein
MGTPFMKIVRLLILAATFGASAIASADDWHIGIAAGVSDYDSTITEEEFADAATATIQPLGTILFSSSKLDNGDAAWKLFVDYDFSDYLAIDIGYTSLGELERFEGDFFVDDGVDPFDAYTVHKVTVGGPYTAVVGKLPIWRSIELQARAGAYRWKIETTAVTTINTVSDSESSDRSGSDAFYGVEIKTDWFGIQYGVYDIDGEDVGFAGFVLRNDLE